MNIFRKLITKYRVKKLKDEFNDHLTKALVSFYNGRINFSDYELSVFKLRKRFQDKFDALTKSK